MRLLLSSGADINQQNLVGSAPLQHISRMTDKLNIVDQLLTYKDLNIDQATHKVSVWLLCRNFSFYLLENSFYHLIFAIIGLNFAKFKSCRLLGFYKSCHKYE